MLIQQFILHIVYQGLYLMMIIDVVLVIFDSLQLYHGTDFEVFVIVILIV